LSPWIEVYREGKGGSRSTKGEGVKPEPVSPNAEKEMSASSNRKGKKKGAAVRDHEGERIRTTLSVQIMPPLSERKGDDEVVHQVEKKKRRKRSP